MNHYLVMYQPPRSGFAESITAEEKAIVVRHYDYLESLKAEGHLVFAGRPEDARFGIALLSAGSLEEATSMMRADPAVQDGLFVGEALPFQASFLP